MSVNQTGVVSRIAPTFTRRMVHEGRRSLMATVLPILPALVVFLLVDTSDDRLTRSVTYVLAYWTLWCTVQSVATYLVFGRCDAPTFAERIGSSSPARRTTWRVLLGLDDGAVSLGTLLSIVMVMVTLFVFTAPELRSNDVVIALAACSVISSWVLTAFSYTISYARVDQRQRGLTFPGETAPDFSDYLYYAVCVNATFATSDVTVVSRDMRRLTTTHTLVAFGFNTIIFALLITLLTGSRL